ncbi:MAG: SusC/RagA family TonB-linked outer membrane protein [Chitinophagaceae bacterium]|nr:SusC/RagA family TonB-linked outer membrane protein [Chitinophagaceae bacterium]
MIKVSTFHLLLMFVFLTAGAKTSDGQAILEKKISVSLNNQKLSVALKMIGELAEVKFSYTRDVEDINKKISLAAQNEELKQVLDKMFQSLNIKYEVMNNYIILTKKGQSSEAAENLLLAAAENIVAAPPKIKGLVLDENGAPLADVSVMVKGANRGVVTNTAGEYTIEADADDVLVFSFVGYETQQVPAKDATQINLKKSGSPLDEVVVTALGISRQKKALSYAVQEVKSDEILENRNSSVANSLEGKVAGLDISKTSTPGGSTRILLRGINSLTNNNMPLIVVDGIPYDNRQGSDWSDGGWGGTDYGDGISNLNQDDIESVSVLKGPTASALYGSRAGNGVLLITTKKGTGNKGPRVTVNSNFTSDRIMIQPDYQNEYGQGSLGEFINTARSSWGPKMDGQILTQANGTWAGLLSNDQTQMLDWTGQSRPFSYAGNDLYHFLQTGNTWNNNVGLNLGSGKTTSRVSMSDTRSTGVVPGNTYAKTGITYRISGEVVKNLTLDASFSYNHQKGVNRPSYAVSGYNPMFGIEYVPRSIHLSDFLPVVDPETGNARLFEPGTPTLVTNPYIALQMKGNQDLTDRINGFTSLKYQFTNWLSLMGRVGMDAYQFNVENWYANGNNISTPYQYGGYNTTETNFREINGDFLLAATKDNLFHSKFSGNISFGGNIMDQQSRNIFADAQGLNIDNVYTIANGVSVTTTNYKYHKQIQSFYGFGQLSYDKWAFLDLTARNDWSSTLPQNNWSFFYPSAGLSIVVSDMLRSYGVNLPSAISYFKLRGSVASAGTDTDPYNLLPVYSTVQGLPGGLNGLILPQDLPNGNLKPEFVSSYELGAELKMFNNRFGVDATYYSKKSKNQIFNVTTSGTTGYISQWINAGEIDNHGIELVLTGTPIQTKDWNWNLTVNYAKNINKVVNLNGASEYLLENPAATNVNVEAIVGRPIGELYTTTQLTNNNGQLLIDNSNPGSNTYYGAPMASSDLTHYAGNVNPNWTGGILSNLSYKGFYLNLMLDIRVGGKIYLNSAKRLFNNGALAPTLQGRDTWYPFFGNYVQTMGSNPYAAPGATTFSDLYAAATNAKAGVYVTGVAASDGTTPMAGYINPQYYYSSPRWGDDHFVYDMTNVRLREISLGYVFPAKLFTKTPIKAIKLSVVANNVLFLKNKLPGFDPESTYGSGNVMGIETASFPSTRSIGFNMNVSF